MGAGDSSAHRMQRARIAAHAAAVGYPILPCNLAARRMEAETRVAAPLDGLEERIPDVRSSLLVNALRNVRPSHLLDLDVGRAWAERSPQIRPSHRAVFAARQHRCTLSVLSGDELAAGGGSRYG